ncbi:MAG TPA: histidinol dehydrogenase [Acidimicrobiia bacterium]
MADLMLTRTDLRNRPVDAGAFRAPAGRSRGEDAGALAAVREIIAAVRARGDEALRDLTERFDGCRIDRFRVPDEELDAAPGDMKSVVFV